jgi:thiamine-monophosphate kinase
LNIAKLGEFGLIERIAGKAPLKPGVRIGIGDDAAAVETGAGLVTLVTTDMLVEGVHFDLAYSDPFSLGRKSLSVNLSDIAAMGGVPRYFLLSMAIPQDLPVEFIDTFIDGILAMGNEFGVSLIGGDTSSSGKGLIISVTLMGEQSPDLVVPRGGALPGDLICVTGVLGDSALGLSLLKVGVSGGLAVRKHLDPVPRVREGIRLAEGKFPSAMIDVSDGLLADLGHILDLSGVGARLFPERLPLSDDYIAQQGLVGGDFYALPLSGGEDYELLFTTSPDKIASVQSVMTEIGTRCTVIGEITAASGISIITATGEEYLQEHQGYNHFPV